MMDLIKTSLGSLTAIGNGGAVQAVPGQHLANIFVTGMGSVSAAGAIQGTNDLTAPWKDIGAFSISGTDSASGTVSWSLDYLYWRLVATGLTGSKLSTTVSSESLEKQGGLVTVMGLNGQPMLDDLSRNAVVRAAGTDVFGYKTSLIADSRMQDYYLSGKRIGGRSWVAWANAYLGCALDVIAEYATSGFRSDQFFAESNFGLMLNDGAQIAIVGYPFVNDIAQAQAGYTDVDGNSVTLANVQALAIARHVDRVQRLVSAGKVVVVCVEPGATALNAAQVAVVHSINAELRDRYRGYGSVKLFDPLSIIWSKAISSTAIAFNSGFSVDGTHATARQGQRVGKYAAEKFFPTFLFVRKSYGIDIATSSAQLYPNAGYATTTGGTTSNITGSDPLPANVLLAATSAGIASYTATIADAEDGTGKELTLNISATGAVEVRVIHNAIPTAGLLYTDKFVGGCDCNVVSASGCRVYGDMQLFTSQGTEDGYALYAGDPADIWLVTGSTGEFRLQSDAVSPPVGSSSGLAPQWRVVIDFKAAGTCTIKLKDPSVYRK